LIGEVVAPRQRPRFQAYFGVVFVLASVTGPALVGLVGSLQATEALKLLAGTGTTLRGRLLLIDALDSEFQTITLQRNPQCPVCGGLG